MSSDTCNCDACQALAAEYQSDPQLLVFYHRKLLVRGWAGLKSPTERAYILAHASWAQAAAKAGTETLRKVHAQPSTQV